MDNTFKVWSTGWDMQRCGAGAFLRHFLLAVSKIRSGNLLLLVGLRYVVLRRITRKTLIWNRNMIL